MNSEGPGIAGGVTVVKMLLLPLLLVGAPPMNCDNISPLAFLRPPGGLLARTVDGGAALTGVV